MHKLSGLVKKLQGDQWRLQVGFSEDIELANQELSDLSLPEESVIAILNRWLHRHQPCLFGRAAAHNGLISYCILRESDLDLPVSRIRDRIQEARKEWTKDAFCGKKSGFIVFLQSPTLVTAEPSRTVLDLAKKICSLYLLTSIQPDRVYLDEVFLESPSDHHQAWKWFAGVNFFSASADQRWWHDHRIPGGIAFSVNSVGHMVKTAKVGWEGGLINSLETALTMAMRTIQNAATGPSGPATMLVPKDSQSITCPHSISKSLSGFDCRKYIGWYHTDQTLPRAYFRPDVERPTGSRVFPLDFTYLFEQDPLNFDYITMGEGRPIRHPRPDSSKRQRTVPILVRVEDEIRLRDLLE